jgi:AAA ATPase domain
MKITQIQFKNYRAFYGTSNANRIELSSGKNLLIYGENGSGKSSIYEGLKSFFASSFSPDIRLSRHLGVPETSEKEGVEIANEVGVTLLFDNNEQYVFGNIGQNTNTTEFITDAHKLSGFLSYRDLLRTHTVNDVYNSDLFEKDFANLLVNKILANRTNSGTGYSYAEDVARLYVSGKGSRPNGEEKHAIVGDFDIGFHRDISEINLLLNDLLHYFDTEINVQLIAKQSISVYDLSLLSLKWQNYPVFRVALNVTLHNIDLQQNNETHLSVLNEARISALALSIYLAALVTTPQEGIQYKPLFLDDIFTGLDMSNRLPLLEILKSFKTPKRKQGIDEQTGRISTSIERNSEGQIVYTETPFFDTYQIFMTTYDRHWFEVAKNYLGSTKWQTIEMYAHHDEVLGFDVPLIIPEKHRLTRVEEYLARHDYRAAAIYLRVHCEAELERILPSFYKKKDGNDQQGNKQTQQLGLNDLILNFEKFCQIENIDFTPFEKLKIHKSYTLNTLSHNDISTPLYRREVLEAKKAIENLGIIKKGKIPAKYKDLCLKLKNKTNEETTIRIKKHDTIEVISVNESPYHLTHNCKCELESIETGGETADINKQFDSLTALHDFACKEYDLTPSTQNLLNIIFNRSRTPNADIETLYDLMQI